MDFCVHSNAFPSKERDENLDNIYTHHLVKMKKKRKLSRDD